MPGGTTTEVTGVWIAITETSTGVYSMKADPIDDSLVTGSVLNLVFETKLTS